MAGCQPRRSEVASGKLGSRFRVCHEHGRSALQVRRADREAGSRCAQRDCKSLARQAQWAAERAEREANKADVDISRIAQSFGSAVASGLRFPKLRLADFTFSLASASGKNAGSIYVKRDEDYLGKIADGKFTRSRDCDTETEAAIVAVCADPAAAAEAYGRMTGQ